MQRISFENPECTNMVKFFKLFNHMGTYCLVFEMLDRDLYDLLMEQRGNPLSLTEIQLIAKQVMCYGNVKKNFFFFYGATIYHYLYDLHMA